MNKKNIILILVGILIISMRFNVTFGHINIDVTNDCVGFLLIIIGVLPMINRNSRFKKSGIVANIQEKSAVTRNYQMTWLILSAAVFAHFMIFGSTISLYSILVEALVGICALYYCFTVYSSSKQLYED